MTITRLFAGRVGFNRRALTEFERWVARVRRGARRLLRRGVFGAIATAREAQADLEEARRRVALRRGSVDPWADRIRRREAAWMVAPNDPVLRAAIAEGGGGRGIEDEVFEELNRIHAERLRARGELIEL